MSRTDKDRPYWVKVQDEGVETHSHHSNQWGRRSRYQTIKVYDDEGNPVMEEREVKLTAKRVIETVPRLKSVAYSEESPFWARWQGFYTTSWKPVSSKLANPVYSEAERLIALGMPEALVTIRIDTVQKVERVWVKGSDECDYSEDVPRDHKEMRERNCSKELPYWKGPGHHCRCSWCRPSDEPRQRTRKRVFLTAMVKRANSGDEDWEDDFNELDLSQPDMHHRGWC